MGRKLVDLETEFDTLTTQLADAIDANADDDTINAIVDALELNEDKRRRQARYLERKQAEQQEIADLIAAGMDEIDAECKVTGKSGEAVIKGRFIAHARSLGYDGAGFDALVTAMHRDMAFHYHAQAQEACNGYMVRGDSSASGYHFWFCADATVQKQATDELIAWFEQNGRITRADLRRHILTGRRIPSFMGRR